MIKVLIINSTLERSGLTNVIYDLVNNIDKVEFDVQILTLSNEPINTRLNDFINIPMVVNSLNFPRNSSFLGVGLKLKKYVECLNPDLIHTNSFRATFLVNLFLSKFKRIATIHGVIEENHSVIYGPFLGKMLAKIELRAFGNANVKTVVSDYLQKYYHKFGNVISIPNGIDNTVFFKISNEEKLKLRTKFGVPHNAKVFVFSGSLIARKDPLLVLNAFLKAKIENSFLVVIGDGPLKKNCLKISQSNMLFLGQIKEVAQIYQLGDCFISASKSEGLGLSVIEASLCGMICLVTDIPPHREIFSNNRNCVRFFKPNSETQLVNLILNTFEVPCNFRDENYMVKNMVVKYQNVYNSLFNSNNIISNGK